MDYKLTKETINRLKVHYYEDWKPEDYRYMEFNLRTGYIGFTNDLDCGGSMYWNYKTFLESISEFT